jgi:hypothetical protein
VSRLLVGLLVFVQLSLFAHGGLLFFALRELDVSKEPILDERTVSRIALSAQQLDALRIQVETLSRSLLESKSIGGDKDRNSSVPVTQPSTAVSAVSKAEPESSARKSVLDAKKITRELGNDALITSKTCIKWDLDTVAGFVRDKSGVAVNIKDPYIAENIGHLIGKHALSMKVLEKDRLLSVAKARKQLEAEGRFEEIPLGMPIPPVRREPGSELFIEHVVSTSQSQRRFLIPPSEFPEILATDEKRSIESFEQMLEEIGTLLADNEAAK